VNITEICIRRPVLAWMIMLATIVFGVVAARRIGISQMPDVDFPTITVNVTREGAAPEVMEKDVVEVLEDALSQVEAIRAITSTSRQGSAQLTVELDLARDVDLAMQDVQARVAQAQRRLPRDLDPPVVSKTNPEDQPILWIAVSGPYPRQKVTDYARYHVRERLQTVPGIGEITMGGYAERNVRIWIDADRLDQRGLTIKELASALTAEHIELPAGRIETGAREIDVRVLGEALSLEQLRRVVVGRSGGSPVHLEDVALVEDGFEDARSRARRDFQPAQGLGIRKQRGANTVAVAAAVRAAMSEIRKGLPEDMHADVIFDTSRFIETSVRDIEHELGLAVLLTAIVCWFFLGSLSSTLNVVLAIPMSLLGTLAVIYFAGFTLNTFTLLAMSLAVGIVVDDAIMVLENIYRHFESGKSAAKAALDGTNEIKFAAFAATLAVCAIFVPVVFMEGIVGKFFFQFGITLSLAVLFSYVEAITLAPARCSQILGRPRGHRPGLGALVDRGFDRIRRGYEWALAKGIRRPGFTLLGALGVLGASVFAVRGIPAEFVPSQDQSRILVRFQTAVGSSLEETDRVMQQSEKFVNGRPEVARAFFVVGGFGGGGVNTGIAFITLVPKSERVGQNEFAALLRRELNSHPGLRAVVQDLSQQGFTARRGFPVEFSVRGSDWDQLVVEADRVAQELRASGKVVDIDTDYQLGMPELRIAPDRARAADLGVPTEDIASAINLLVGGARVGRFTAEGRRIDVRVRLLAEQRSRPESLSQIKVRAASGTLVPLSALISQEERPTAQTITRRERERAITVYGNVAPGSSQDEALAEVERLAANMPDGARLVLGGASVAFRESFDSLLFALVLGVIVAYMVLAAQFNSFIHPVTVLTILPLSIAGAVFALLASGRTLNVFSMIGLLLLMGIVKKNSIILVDYANQLREGGASARDAMGSAGPIRLRPILMTSMATLMAATPAALGLGEGSETRVPMAIAVIGGLVVSTALSLLVVPAFYVMVDDAGTWLKRTFRRARRPEAAPGA
jgi:multidrug efflux pump